MNALTMPMRAELKHHLEALSADADVRSIVIAARGKAFCSGGDLKSLQNTPSETAFERFSAAQPIVRAITESKKPVIVAVDGFAIGAGFALVLACDIIVAAPAAKFSASFAKVGLGADFGLSWTLPRRVGIGRAKLMLMTGQTISATQAEAWGIVDQLATTGTAIECAAAIAREIATNAPIALDMIKRNLAQGFVNLEQAMSFETSAQTMLTTTNDFKEGIGAFLERRTARFTGE
jgi:enoyl-CoA hydratase/carnithine racemase